MDKSILRQAILAQLTTELELLTRAALMAREEATSEESKAENKYDTRGQEAAYLAEGQARIAAELQESCALFQSLPLSNFTASDAIAVGAIVTLSSDRHSHTYFIAPRNGGMELKLLERDILLVTPASPLGRQLIGRHVGDDVQLPSGKKSTAYRIASIA